MIGELSPDRVVALLRESVVGRIGCHADGRTYIVPVAYAYSDDGCVYGHSGEGMKLRMMRANPDVCFEVERLVDMGTWETVIAWGTFEELGGDAARAGMRLLVERLSPLVTGGSAGSRERLTPVLEELTSRALHNGVVYRIRVTTATGRFEQSHPSSSETARALGHVAGS